MLAELGPEEATEAELIRAALERTRAGHLVCDIRTNLMRSALKQIRDAGVGVTVLDDASPRRLAGDLAVYPLVPAVDDLGWGGYEGRVLAGGEWTLLSRKVSSAAASTPNSGKGADHRILVTMGGSDPMNWTLPIVQACAVRTWPLGTTVDVVVGPGFANKDGVAEALSEIGGVELHLDPPNLQELMVRSSLAIASFGVSAYELAALGIPSVYVFVSEDHRRSASSLVSAGAGFAAGAPGAISPERVAKSAALLVQDESACQVMSEAGKNAIDAKAAERLAAEIKTLMKHHQEAPQVPVQPDETLQTNRPASSA